MPPRLYRSAGFEGDTVAESGAGPAVLMIFAAPPDSSMASPPRGPA